MTKSTILPLIVTLIVILSGKSMIFEGEFVNENSNFQSSNSKDSVAVELRIHAPGDNWSAQEQILWHPNHIESFRTIQFSIRIIGLSIAEFSQSEISLARTNGQVVDTIILNSNDFYNLDGNPNAMFNYSYVNDFGIGDISVELMVFENDGTQHNFQHEGLSFSYVQPFFVLENHDQTVWYIDGDSLVFEFFVQNVGGRDKLEIEMDLTSQIPSSWNSNQWNVSFPISLDPGQNITLNYSISIPKGNTDTLERIEFELRSNYYDRPTDSTIQLNTLFQEFNLSKFAGLNAISAAVYETQIGLVYQTESASQFEFSMREHSMFLDKSNDLLLKVEITNTGVQDLNLILDLLSNTELPEILIGEEITKLDSDFETFVAGLEPLKSLNTLVFYMKISPNQLSITQDIAIDFSLQVRSDNIESLLELPIFIPMYNSLNVRLVNDNTDITFNNTDSVNFSFTLRSVSLNQYQNLPNSWNLSTDIIGLVGDASFNTIQYCNDQVVESTNFSLVVSTNPPNSGGNNVGNNCSLLISIYGDWSTGNYSLELVLTHVNQPDSIQSPFVWSFPINYIEQDTTDDHSVNNQSNTDNETLPENNTDITNNTDNNISNNSQNNSDSVINNTDSDQDGIIDSLDNCSNTPLNSTVDTNGCIILDQQEQNKENSQDNEVSSNDDEKFVYVTWLIPIIIVVAIGIYLVSRIKRQAHIGEKATIEPINELPPMPSPAQIVVLQQWTDDSGYSWRMMSDKSVMWWNGSDWIPYSKN